MRSLVVILSILTLFACKNKKSMAGEDKVVMNDFVEAYPSLKLPWTVSDTSMDNTADTTTIAYNIFTQFVPDTILNTPFGTDRKLTIHPIGRFGEKGKETYLTALVKSKSKSAIYLMVLTKKNAFVTSMPLLTTNNDSKFKNSATIDSRLTISIQKDWKTDAEALFSRTIYAYNTAGLFTVVMTETNDRSGLANNINNPLDTMPRRNKYSGDYQKNKKNFLTIRDGSTPDSYLFFVHFENETDEPCNGELKGAFSLATPTSATFSENNDPCVIDFTFQGNNISVKEQGNCGSHRGIKCFFNDTYTKKKEAKPEKASAKPAKKK